MKTITKWLSHLGIWGLSLGLMPLAAEPRNSLDWRRFFSDARMTQVEQLYGVAGKERVADLRDWLAIHADIDVDVKQRLALVNDYFNQFEFVSDSDHWQQRDYWATPIEMVASGGGDCEDFSIAKYFALRVLALPPEQLRLMYVKSLELNQAHMVLLYLEQQDGMPLVLDNLTDQIKPGDQRLDLQPVYSFNAEGLWRARAFDQGVQLSAGDNGIELWGDLLRRIAQEEAMQ